MRRSTRLLALIPVLALTLSACSGDAERRPAADGAVAVATTTMLGSVLGDITECAGTTSFSVMSPGDDPHTFSLSSDQVAAMVRADLVVANGLGLEQGISSALANVTADGGTVFEVAPTVDPIAFGDHEGHDHDAAEHEGHDHGSEDPHFWLDVSRMSRAAANIGAELARATGDETYAGCGKQVASELEDTHEQVKQILAVVPEERRVLVTDHDAFGYFAQAYGFRVVGVVVPGGSTDAEPSSQDLAAITDVIRTHNVAAIFSNTAASDKLVKAVAAEAGQDVRIIPLHVGSVGPKGSDADTYAKMMTANATLIAEALG